MSRVAHCAHPADRAQLQGIPTKLRISGSRGVKVKADCDVVLLIDKSTEIKSQYRRQTPLQPIQYQCDMDGQDHALSNGTGGANFLM